jgi:hypothetical protein
MNSPLAVGDLGRVIKRIDKLADDDRFDQNRETISIRYRSDLKRAVDALELVNYRLILDEKAEAARITTALRDWAISVDITDPPATMGVVFGLAGGLMEQVAELMGNAGHGEEGVALIEGCVQCRDCS